jgi:hypothetical protein
MNQWCPVCKQYHQNVGEMTDAGTVTRACPNVPTDHPRYFGSRVYTGDRGREVDAEAKYCVGYEPGSAF